ncbi:hypothetical protein [Streptomyces sp. NBC_01236]|uniref:hypothetical protein n=1 Tax=Streptomyces sp. NBC_01236 TaxID=2903789 RepID=UPI002E129ACC|nr:hypothetical protein OG324_29715 [Streptomyces sp. NBC_01236]
MASEWNWGSGEGLLRINDPADWDAAYKRDAAMAIVDELGRFRDHEVSAVFLLLWSGGLEVVPRDLAELEEPLRVRRKCRMAADLQLTHFLQALITAAIAAETEAGRGPEGVAEVLRSATDLTATDLADESGRSASAEVFRVGRVAHLPGILRPELDSFSCLSGRALGGLEQHG